MGAECLTPFVVLFGCVHGSSKHQGAKHVGSSKLLSDTVYVDSIKDMVFRSLPRKSWDLLRLAEDISEEVLSDLSTEVDVLDGGLDPALLTLTENLDLLPAFSWPWEKKMISLYSILETMETHVCRWEAIPLKRLWNEFELRCTLRWHKAVQSDGAHVYALPTMERLGFAYPAALDKVLFLIIVESFFTQVPLASFLCVEIWTIENL